MKLIPPNFCYICAKKLVPAINGKRTHGFSDRDEYMWCPVCEQFREYIDGERR